jgi:hypothetical protein
VDALLYCDVSLPLSYWSCFIETFLGPGPLVLVGELITFSCSLMQSLFTGL